MWRLRPDVLLGAIWAWVSVVRVRRDLKRNGLAHKTLATPRLPKSARRGVQGVLARLAPTCLERALVWQAWLAAVEEPRDVVIGVLPQGVNGDGSPAHAWVDGTDPESQSRYRELHRIRAVR